MEMVDAPYPNYMYTCNITHLPAHLNIGVYTILLGSPSYYTTIANLMYLQWNLWVTDTAGPP